MHLKRFSFSFSHHGTGKITTPVAFEDECNLAPFTVTGESTRYQLYAVLVHDGASTHSGHYYAFTRAPVAAYPPATPPPAGEGGGGPPAWYLFNDSHVRRVSESDVRHAASYILFYSMADAAAFNRKAPPPPPSAATRPATAKGQGSGGAPAAAVPPPKTTAAEAPVAARPGTPPSSSSPTSNGFIGPHLPPPAASAAAAAVGAARAAAQQQEQEHVEHEGASQPLDETTAGGAAAGGGAVAPGGAPQDDAPDGAQDGAQDGVQGGAQDGGGQQLHSGLEAAKGVGAVSGMAADGRPPAATTPAVRGTKRARDGEGNSEGDGDGAGAGPSDGAAASQRAASQRTTSVASVPLPYEVLSADAVRFALGIGDTHGDLPSAAAASSPGDAPLSLGTRALDTAPAAGERRRERLEAMYHADPRMRRQMDELGRALLHAVGQSPWWQVVEKEMEADARRCVAALSPEPPRSAEERRQQEAALCAMLDGGPDAIAQGESRFDQALLRRLQHDGSLDPGQQMLNLADVYRDALQAAHAMP